MLHIRSLKTCVIFPCCVQFLTLFLLSFYIFEKSLPLFFFFSYLGFVSQILTIDRTVGEGGGYLFNSSLPLPPGLQTIIHWPDVYWIKLTSVHSWQQDSNRKPLVSERKSVTIRVHKKQISQFTHFNILLLIVTNVLVLLHTCTYWTENE